MALGLVLAACGGSVSTGSGGSTGAGASSGSGSTTGTTGTGGGTTTGGGCPANEPTSGAPCSDPTLSCHYGSCCAATATCDGTTWQVSLPPCVAPQCPQTMPAEGDTCSPCVDPISCDFGCVGSSELGGAGCGDDGAWHVSIACPPPDPPTCGNVTCKAGEVCFVKSGGAIMQPSCIANPCGSAALDCSCAASVCGGAPFQCSVSGQTLSCTCPNCP